MTVALGEDWDSIGCRSKLLETRIVNIGGLMVASHLLFLSDRINRLSQYGAPLAWFLVL